MTCTRASRTTSTSTSTSTISPLGGRVAGGDDSEEARNQAGILHWQGQWQQPGSFKFPPLEPKGATCTLESLTAREPELPVPTEQQARSKPD
jgi:hypothetical protein